jgi:POT family proton-dependent oligopeptide transporter
MAYVLTPFALAGFLIVLAYALRSEKVVRERLFVVLVLTLFNVLFWAFFEQAGSSISLFTDRNVDRALFDTFIPTAAFQSVNPMFILLFALPFSFLWLYLERRHMDPPLAVKFSLGLLQLGLGFLVLTWAAKFAFVGHRPGDHEGEVIQAAVVPMIFLFGGYLLHTTGELCLSPIGLSMVTKLSPKKIVAMVMGLWFLSTSLSHEIAGHIATLTAPEPTKETMPGWLAQRAGILAQDAHHPATVMQSFDQLASYTEVFQVVGLIAIGAGVVLLFLSPVIKKWQHGLG